MMFKAPLKKLCSQYQNDLNGSFPEEVLRYYTSQYSIRVKGYKSEDDGDMLLFQSGVYDWGRGKNLEIDFVRQFIKSEGEIFQLHTTFNFSPPAGNSKKYVEESWLSDSGEIENWSSEILQSDVMKQFGKETTVMPEIYLENAE